MTSRFRTSLRTAVALMATVLGHPAYGQDAAPAAPDRARRRRADAAQAGDLRRRDLSVGRPGRAACKAHVDLEMTIDATGKVTEARVRRARGRRLRRGGRSKPRAGSSSSRPDAATAPSRRASSIATSSSWPRQRPAAHDGRARGQGAVARRRPERRRRARHHRRADGQTARTALTDASGAFHFTALAAGTSSRRARRLRRCAACCRRGGRRR